MPEHICMPKNRLDVRTYASCKNFRAYARTHAIAYVRTALKFIDRGGGVLRIYLTWCQSTDLPGLVSVHMSFQITKNRVLPPHLDHCSTAKSIPQTPPEDLVFPLKGRRKTGPAGKDGLRMEPTVPTPCAVSDV